MVQHREPVSLGAALQELIAMRGFARKQAHSELQTIWLQVAEPQWASATTARAIRRGTLTIDVANAPLMSELIAFHAPQLLAALQTRAPHWKLKKLKFEMG